MLSKTLFLSGCQCPKRLWLEVHRKDLRPILTPAAEERFAQGHEVGGAARQLTPDGVHIGATGGDSASLVAATVDVMSGDSTRAVFEGAFEHDDVLVRADILRRFGMGEWVLQEVKSSTRVKDEHLLDVAVQAHVLKGSGTQVGKAGILHLRKDYVLGPDGLDLNALFTFADLTGGIDDISGDVAAKVTSFREIVALDEPPNIDPGPQCKTPRDCPFRGFCIPPAGPYDLSQLPSAKKLIAELRTLGVDDIREIPDDVHLTAMQQRVRDCVVSDEEFVGAGLGAALNAVRWPLMFLDFETCQSAIPRFTGTGVYRQLPVQWSLHVLQRDGTLHHREFIHDDDSDPRLPFALSLLEALQGDGSIVVYSSFEKTIIKKLAEDLFHVAIGLEALLPRLHDLMKVIRRDYYHPAFRGSFSIKKVLPALVPALDYSDLQIQGGAAAAALYRRMIDSDTPIAERDSIRENLLRYCERDTLAMVKVREALAARC